MATRYHIRGPHGAIAVVTVPSAGLDQRTFDARVEAGEYTVVEGLGSDAEPPPGNATTEEWHDYATSLGVEVPEDAGREDIKQLLGDR